MNLSDLFSVYNEVVPETKETKKIDKKSEKLNFYTPLTQIDRVREVLKTDNPEETSESPNTSFSWNWSYTEPKSEDVVVPYKEGVTPTAKVLSANLESYRTDKYLSEEIVFNSPKILTKKTKLMD